MTGNPPEAIAAAANRDLLDQAVRAAGDRIGVYEPGNPGFWSMFRIGLEAAAPLIAAAERERLYAELGNDHFVIFTEDGWTTEHSVECRLSGHMHECAYHTRMTSFANEHGPGMPGRWRIVSIDGDAGPVLELADLTGGDGR